MGTAGLFLFAGAQFLGVATMDGHCMTGVSNSEHGSRVTNIHTHGLHVFPGIIAPGLYGDYVLDPSDGGVVPGQSRQYEYHLRHDHRDEEDPAADDVGNDDGGRVERAEATVE